MIRLRSQHGATIGRRCINGYRQTSLSRSEVISPFLLDVDVQGSKSQWGYQEVSNSVSYGSSNSLFARNFSTNKADDDDFGASKSEGNTSSSLDELLEKLAKEENVSDAVSNGILEDVSVQAAVELSNSNPADLLIKLLSNIHEVSGPEVPFAMVIIGTTIAIRTLFLPLAIKSQKNSSRMAHMKPEMDQLKERTQRLQSKGNVTQEMNLKLADDMKSLFKKYDCNPLQSLLLPVVQFPTFMSMFFALKKIPEVYPEEIATGGILWFHNLAASDPYLILPLISAGSFLAMIESTKETMMASNAEQGKIMIMVFRGMSLIMVPITMNFPTSLFCYWVTNNAFSLGQTLLLKVPVVKKSFGIWNPPKPVPGAPAPKGIVDELKEAFSKKNEDAKAIAAKKGNTHVDYTLPRADPLRRVGSKKSRRNRSKRGKK